MSLEPGCESTRAVGPPGIEGGRGEVITASRPARRWMALVGGILAGLFGFGLGEVGHSTFSAKSVRQVVSGVAMMRPSGETRNTAIGQNSALVHGGFGAAMGLFLGLAGGLARSSATRGIFAGLLGLVAGGAVGAGLAWAESGAFFRLLEDFRDQELLLGLSLHGLLRGAIGFVGGMAFGLGLQGLRDWPRYALAGLLGALAATMVSDLAGSLLFPLGGADQPLPETLATRLLAFLVTGTLAGAAVSQFKSSNIQL